MPLKTVTTVTDMHEEHPDDEAEALAVADLLVQQTVGLEQVEQLQLTIAQLGREVGMTRKRATYK